MDFGSAFAVAFLIAGTAAVVGVPVLLWTIFRRLRALESEHDADETGDPVPFKRGRPHA